MSGHRKSPKMEATATCRKLQVLLTERLLGRAMKHHKTLWNCLRAAQGAGKLRNSLWICANLKRAITSHPWSSRGLFWESERIWFLGVHPKQIKEEWTTSFRRSTNRNFYFYLSWHENKLLLSLCKDSLKRQSAAFPRIKKKDTLEY